MRSFGPQAVMLQTQNIARLIQQLFGLAPKSAGDIEVNVMSSLSVTGLAASNPIIQILGAEFSLDVFVNYATF